MYSVLIADDEKNIREGLVKYICWEDFGFYVKASFSDGFECIEYIKSNKVDLIVTDIKMKKVSGIEVSKYVNSMSGIKPKIILLSGYKDFELARSAIKYGVYTYLTKPTEEEEMHQALAEIKEILDHEARDDELFCILQSQILSDILSRSISSKSEIIGRMKSCNLEYRPDVSKFIFFHIDILNYHEILEKKWEYGRERFLIAINNFLKHKTIRYYLSYSLDSKIDVLGIYDHVDALFEKEMSDVVSELDHALGIRISYKMAKEFANLDEFLNEFTKSEDNDLCKSIAEKLFLCYNEGNLDAIHETLFNCHNPDSHYNDNKRILENVYDEFLEKLSKDSIVIQKLSDFKISDVKNNQNLLDLNRKLCNILADSSREFATSSADKIIELSKAYIKSNYNKDITLVEVASQVFLSPIYFCKLFKQKTGENYTDYLIKVRIEKAKELLRDPQNKVSNICSDIGYKTLRYFYSLFKNYTGMTPTQYRENIGIKK